jgi:large subunit ribosomal protein L23
MFNVKVESVNVMNVRPKTKRVGRYTGKTNRRRKAIVKLAEGHKIDLFGEE